MHHEPFGHPDLTHISQSHAEACGLFNIAHELRMEEAERAIERSCNQAVGR